VNRRVARTDEIFEPPKHTSGHCGR